ncbi:DUF4190 domain-containing protein [Sorangium cellulosum]|uniref:DUF4190 domain-containing protein n=1 Tax=Sorangium cellulosum TaxID=56 RepID=UPI0018F5F134|nr:DUF4190 domain-containing protein [Sorangium cellulosum]
MSHAFGPSQSPPNRDANEPAEALRDARADFLPCEGELPVGAPSCDQAAPAAVAPAAAPWGGAPAQPSSGGAPAQLPFIQDPYLAPPLPPERRQLSTLAVSSVVAALFGPLGAVAAIVFGWAARREIERAPDARRGYALASVGLSLGVLLTLCWSSAIGFGVWMWTTYSGGEIASAVGEGETSPEPASAASPAAPLPDVPPPAAAQPGGSVPQHTIQRRVGGLSIVDIGVDVSTLSEELAKQRAEAHARGEKVLVMTTSDPCEPCRGVDRSLSDPLMQTALRSVRLVRVDIDVFKEDLDQIKMPRRLYPGFFLLSPDLTPQDGINGGEWDDDIARNIAPVLGAFVRGQYTTRRQPWHPLPGSGMRL